MQRGDEVQPYGALTQEPCHPVQEQERSGVRSKEGDESGIGRVQTDDVTHFHAYPYTVLRKCCDCNGAKLVGDQECAGSGLAELGAHITTSCVLHVECMI